MYGVLPAPRVVQWLSQRQRSRPFIELLTPLLSQVTATELRDAPEKVQAVYAELLMLGTEIIEASESALELADAHQAHGILTPKFYDDGLHIAVATVGAADVLVSWNFKHIVHFDWKLREA